MVNHLSYKDAEGGWVYPDLVVERDGGTLIRRDSGLAVEPQRVESMSKSKRNIVDPDAIIDQYGADTARWFMLSDSPPERDLVWTTAGVEGAWRFVQRLWRLVDAAVVELPSPGTPVPDTVSEASLAVRRQVHKTIAGVTGDIEALHLNRAVARIHELANALGTAGEGTLEPAVQREALEVLTRLSAPMMPHLAEELWQKLGHETMLAATMWPEARPELLQEDRVTIAVQVRGKLRDTIELAQGASEDEAREAALASGKVQRAISGQSIRKVIVVPDRIVNIVV